VEFIPLFSESRADCGTYTHVVHLCSYLTADNNSCQEYDITDVIQNVRAASSCLPACLPSICRITTAATAAAAAAGVTDSNALTEFASAVLRAKAGCRWEEWKEMLGFAARPRICSEESRGAAAAVGVVGRDGLLQNSRYSSARATFHRTDR